MKPIRFGTDGVRGPAGVWPITELAAARMGQVAASHGRVLIAHDTRPSGAALASALADGVVRGGGVAVSLDVLPTPGLAMALEAGEGQLGVMITASHNAAPDNGFKVLDASGRKLDDQGIAAFEAALAALGKARSVSTKPSFPYGPLLHVAGRTVPASLTRSAGSKAQSLRGPYSRSLLVSPPRAVGQGQREASSGPWRRWADAVLHAADAVQGPLVVDLAHGAASGLATALRGLGWAVLGDGGGTINQGVGSEHIAAVQAAVRAGGFQAGVAVDGDADRCVLIDERGERVHGDALIGLLARRRGVDGLAVTVMSSLSLERALPGVQVVRTPVGDRHLRAAMDAHGLALGGEESGHVLFNDTIAGDGLLTGLRALAGLQHPLSQTVAPFAPLPRATRKLTVARRPPLESVSALVDACAQGEAQLVEGRVFVRYSGTEPILRVLVEGAAGSPVDAVADAIVEAARGVLA